MGTPDSQAGRAPNAARGRRARSRLLALCIGTSLAALAVESGVRWRLEWLDLRPLASAWRAQATGQLVPSLVPHDDVGFVRNPRASPSVNSAGFCAPEWALERTQGVLRIACLGASTTEPDPVDGIPGSYPEQLRRELEARTAQAVEVMNFGISGWTSLEIEACWRLIAKRYRPDLVIVHEAINDATARSFPDFRADYGHFRKPLELPNPGALERWALQWSDAWLVFRLREGLRSVAEATIRRPTGPTTFRDGRFPPGTQEPYRTRFEAIVTDARAAGAHVLLATLPWDPTLEEAGDPTTAMHRCAMREHNAIVRELAASQGVMLCDLERLAEREPEALAGTFKDIVHLTTAGNGAKARWIADVLVREWEPLREPPTR